VHHNKIHRRSEHQFAVQCQLFCSSTSNRTVPTPLLFHTATSATFLFPLGITSVPTSRSSVNPWSSARFCYKDDHRSAPIQSQSVTALLARHCRPYEVFSGPTSYIALPLVYNSGHTFTMAHATNPLLPALISNECGSTSLPTVLCYLKMLTSARHVSFPEHVGNWSMTMV